MTSGLNRGREPPLVVRARGLSSKCGKHWALRDVTVDVPAGLTGLRDDTGSGGSAFIGLCAGVLAPTSGDLTVLGIDVRTSPYLLRSRVGYVPSRDCLPRSIAAVDFVAHMARLSGVPASRARDRAVDVLGMFGLREVGLRAMGGYSTGQRQRVKLAQAVAHAPRAVFLDQPLTGLDAAARRDVLTLLRQLSESLGISVVLTSEESADLEATVDRVISLRDGEPQAESGGERLDRGHQVIVHVRGPIDDLVLHLRQAGLDASREQPEASGLILVSAPDDRSLDVLRDAISATGASLVSLDRLAVDGHGHD